MLHDRKKAFADPNEALPYSTSVVATIRTVDEEPIHAKLYPYPMGAADFVNGEIQELLKNGIIQKSRSPYNNPIWVVDKEGTDETGGDNALAGQAAANLQKEREFRQVIDALTSQVAELRTAPTTSRSSAPTPEIKVYAAIEIRDTVQCSEPLFRGGKPPPLPTTYLDDTMVVHAIIRQ